MMSQTLTSSTHGDAARCGKYMRETLPHPMSPTLILRGSPAVADTSSGAARAAPVACRNDRRVEWKAAEGGGF
jgi:hypothetical protein